MPKVVYSIVFPDYATNPVFTKKVRLLKEELQLLQEPGSYVGEVVKVMGKNKVLVKVCRAGNLGRENGGLRKN